MIERLPCGCKKWGSLGLRSPDDLFGKHGLWLFPDGTRYSDSDEGWRVLELHHECVDGPFKTWQDAYIAANHIADGSPAGECCLHLEEVHE